MEVQEKFVFKNILNFYNTPSNWTICPIELIRMIFFLQIDLACLLRPQHLTNSCVWKDSREVYTWYGRVKEPNWGICSLGRWIHATSEYDSTLRYDYDGEFISHYSFDYTLWLVQFSDEVSIVTGKLWLRGTNIGLFVHWSLQTK